ncbi:hypothetical protein H2203_004425 [Taxawa tesnikishii (nom. ined.)]|nr:hypothetical protein H2203_004425 [Dothideales sp. JES 119]
MKSLTFAFALAFASLNFLSASAAPTSESTQLSKRDDHKCVVQASVIDSWEENNGATKRYRIAYSANYTGFNPKDAYDIWANDTITKDCNPMRLFLGFYYISTIQSWVLDDSENKTRTDDKKLTPEKTVTCMKDALLNELKTRGNGCDTIKGLPYYGSSWGGAI